MYTDQTFFDKIKPFVIADMKKTRIPASLTAAQAYIESNKGNSGLTVKCNNLFGIKGTYNGQFGKFMTTEYYNGKAQRVLADFRAYPSWSESISDHSAMFLRMPRYHNLIGCKDYKQACIFVKQDGYATSPTYTQTLTNTIERFKLYEWDTEALVPAQTPTTNNKPSTTTKYEIGKTYTLQKSMYVRTEPNGANVLFSQLSANAKVHAMKGSAGEGVLKLGTKVTVKEVKESAGTWIRIPSGWICAVGKDGKVYIK